MKRLILLPLLLLSLSGCATSAPSVVAGKSLLAIQQTIINTREAIGVPCQKGYISAADCQHMDSIYQQSKPAYDVAADAEIVWLTGGDPTLYQQKLAALQSLEAEMLGLAGKYAKGGAQ